MSKILADCGARECSWPLDLWSRPPVNADTSQQPFCCEPVTGERTPYCPGHTWDAYPRRRHGDRP